jgi:hypothetical protein
MELTPYVVSHELSRRLQFGVLAGALLLILLPVVVFGVTSDRVRGAILPIVILALVAGFRKLTVSVGSESLTVSFAYGWPRRTINLSDIAGVSVHRMRVIYGWGIRFVRHGTLWRAAGHHAARLELSNGRYLYLGVSDCEALAREISERLPAR